MSKNPRHFYQFSQFRFYTDELLLELDGVSAGLGERAKKVLLFLLKNRDRFVGSEELLQEIWGGRGESSSVYRSIAELKSNRFLRKHISHEHGTGYRFVAKEVVEKYEGEPSLSVAVLPFKPYGGSKKQHDSFGLSTADTLIIKLGNIRQLIVRPTSSILKYDTLEEVDSSVAGKQLGVDRILNGHFEREDEHLTVNVQLVDVERNAVIWGKEFREQFANRLAMEADIANEVASTLVPGLSPGQKHQLGRCDTGNSEAYALYSQGRFCWHRSASQELEKAIVFFKKALEVDPNYARAYAGIADACTLLAWFGNVPPKDIRPLVREYATKALQLCDLPEAHTSLATYLECYERNMIDAEDHYRQACDQYPNYDIGHQAFGDYLARMKRFPEAHVEYDNALSIHPDSPFTNAMKAWAYVFDRRAEKAIAQAEIALTYNKDYFLAYLVMGEAYQQLGNHERALSVIDKAVSCSGGHSFAKTWLAIARALAGKREAGLNDLDELQEKSTHLYVPPYFIALIYANLGQYDNAFRWLKKACEERDSYFHYALVEPYFSTELRSDSRFVSILSAGNLLPQSGAGHQA